MTDPLVELEHARLQVNPGGQVSVRVTVRNMGHIIEGFRLDVLGVGVSEWAEVSPAEVRVDVDQEASAVVVFTPPTGSATPTGSLAFAVRATSLVDPMSSAVVEGDLEVGRVFGLTSKITPVTSTGRWRGNHRVEFTNWGNAPVNLILTASDPDERLGFLVSPDHVGVPLGGTVAANVKVRTRKPFLRGTPVRLPFQVVGEPLGSGLPGGAAQPGPPDGQRQVLDGALLQKPIIGRLVVAVAALAAAALVAAVVLGVRNRNGSDGGSVATPDAPANFTVTGKTDSAIYLSWDSEPGVKSYTILEYTSPTDTHVTKTIPDIDPLLGRQVASELAASTRYCFEIVAVSETQSPPSARTCGKTLAAPVDTITAPGGLAATKATQTSITLAWDPGAGSAVDYLQLRTVAQDDPTRVSGVLKVDKDLTVSEVKGLLPGTTYCFQIVGVKGTEQSRPAPTEPVCHSTSTGTSTTGRTTPPADGGATPAAGDWVIVVGQSLSQDDAEAKAAVWRQNGFVNAGSLVDPGGSGEILVYADFAPTLEDAERVCASDVRRVLPNEPCVTPSDIIQVAPPPP
jgi:Fibronectin type III domain